MLSTKKNVLTTSLKLCCQRSRKRVGTKPVIMYGICKVREDIIDNCPPFRPILSAINTPSYKLAKLFVPILKALTKR